jgi:hypothetical protein
MRNRVYISARFGRREEMVEVSKAITKLGYEDVSRWLVLEEGAYPSEKEFRDRAHLDMSDVYACDILVRFTDDLSAPTVPSAWCTASRFEETGMAQALGKYIIVVGGTQSLFDRLESRIHVANKVELYATLRVMLYNSVEDFQ